MTNREHDYAVIGELARALDDPRDQLCYARSARDLLELGAKHEDLVAQLVEQRPLLSTLAEGRDAVERALDAERRALMRANEERLTTYLEAARTWLKRWPAVEQEIAGKALSEAHAIVVRHADGCLPFVPPRQPDHPSESAGGTG